MTKNWKKHCRIYDRKRRHWWKRYFKRMGRRRYWKLRLATAVLFLVSVIYLGCVGGIKNQLIRSTEDWAVEFWDERDGMLELHGPGKGGWRLVFRLKTGEIEFRLEDETVETVESEESTALEESTAPMESAVTAESTEPAGSSATAESASAAGFIK